MALFKSTMMLVTMFLFCTFTVLGQNMKDCLTVFDKADAAAYFEDFQKKDFDYESRKTAYDEKKNEIEKYFVCLENAKDASEKVKKSITETKESLKNTEKRSELVSNCLKKEEDAKDVCEKEKDDFMTAAKDLVYKVIALVSEFLPVKLVKFLKRVFLFGGFIGRKTVDTVVLGYKALVTLFKNGAKLVVMTGEALVASLKFIGESIGRVSKAAWNKFFGKSNDGSNDDVSNYKESEEIYYEVENVVGSKVEDVSIYKELAEQHYEVDGVSQTLKGDIWTVDTNKIEATVVFRGKQLLEKLERRVEETYKEVEYELKNNPIDQKKLKELKDKHDKKVLEELNKMYEALKALKIDGEVDPLGENFADNSINALLYTYYKYGYNLPADMTLEKEMELKMNSKFGILEKEVFKQTEEYREMKGGMNDLLKKGMNESRKEFKSMLNGLSEEKKAEFEKELEKLNELLQEFEREL